MRVQSLKRLAAAAGMVVVLTAAVGVPTLSFVSGHGGITSNSSTEGNSPAS